MTRLSGLLTEVNKGILTEGNKVSKGETSSFGKAVLHDTVWTLFKNVVQNSQTPQVFMMSRTRSRHGIWPSAATRIARRVGRTSAQTFGSETLRPYSTGTGRSRRNAIWLGKARTKIKAHESWPPALSMGGDFAGNYEVLAVNRLIFAWLRCSALTDLCLFPTSHHIRGCCSAVPGRHCPHIATRSLCLGAAWLDSRSFVFGLLFCVADFRLRDGLQALKNVQTPEPTTAFPLTGARRLHGIRLHGIRRSHGCLPNGSQRNCVRRSGANQNSCGSDLFRLQNHADGTIRPHSSRSHRCKGRQKDQKKCHRHSRRAKGLPLRQLRFSFSLCISLFRLFPNLEIGCPIEFLFLLSR